MAYPDSILLRGTRAAQPAATAVAPGTLYSVSDESNLVEQSDGATWYTYAGAGGGGGGLAVGVSTGGNTAGDTGVFTGRVVFVGSNNITLSGSSNAGSATVSILGGAGAGSLNVSAGTTSQNLTNVVFSNSNGVSFGLNGSTVTGSHNGLTSQSNQALSAGNGSFAFQTASFSNANGVSFSTSAGSAIVASHNGLTSQSNQALSGSNGSFTFQTATFGNANGLSFLTSNGSLVGSYTVPSVPVVSNAIQPVGSATGSGTNTSRFAADDHVHEGVFSVGVTNAGNTVGDTRVGPGRYVFEGGNNITLSQITGANAVNTIVISGANAGGAQTGISGIIASDATYTSGSVYFSNQANVTIGSSVDGASQYVRLSVHAPQTGISGLQVSDATYTSGTVTFQNANGITFGSSGANGISASHNGLTSQSNQAASAANGSFAFQTLSFSNVNGISFVTAGGSAIQASHNGLTSQSNQAVSAGNGSYAFQTLSFSNANNFTFATSAGSAIVGSYTVPTVPAQLSVGVSTGGNTAGDTGVFTGRVVFVGSNNITLSGSSNAGSATVSVIGGAGGGGGVTYSQFNPYDQVGSMVTGVFGGSLFMNPKTFPNLVCDRALQIMSYSMNAASTGSFTVSAHVALYTRNVSTLSLLTSGSTSFALTGSGTVGDFSLYGGQRYLSVPFAATVTEGQYWLANIFRTSGAGNNGTFRRLAQGTVALGFSGEFGAASIASAQSQLGAGIYSVTTADLPSSIAFSEIADADNNAREWPIVMFQNGTI
jgi:fibronectin-binding autotransporter adhesin